MQIPPGCSIPTDSVIQHCILPLLPVYKAVNRILDNAKETPSKEDIRIVWLTFDSLTLSCDEMERQWQFVGKYLGTSLRDFQLSYRLLAHKCLVASKPVMDTKYLVDFLQNFDAMRRKKAPMPELPKSIIVGDYTDKDIEAVLDGRTTPDMEFWEKIARVVNG